MRPIRRAALRWQLARLRYFMDQAVAASAGRDLTPAEQESLAAGAAWERRLVAELKELEGSRR